MMMLAIELEQGLIQVTAQQTPVRRQLPLENKVTPLFYFFHPSLYAMCLNLSAIDEQTCKIYSLISPVNQRVYTSELLYIKAKLLCCCSVIIHMSAKTKNTL